MRDLLVVFSSGSKGECQGEQRHSLLFFFFSSSSSSFSPVIQVKCPRKTSFSISRTT